jgi:hypothetical protein
MDKKQIMKMNDAWKDFRLQESPKVVTEAPRVFSGAQHGFDLSDFKAGGFQRVLKALSIPMIAKGSASGKSWSDGDIFYWKGRDVVIVTGNNPITGVFRNKANRAPEKNYASYIGIETKDPKKMPEIVKLIKKNLSYYKDESKGRRDFI